MKENCGPDEIIMETEGNFDDASNNNTL